MGDGDRRDPTTEVLTPGGDPVLAARFTVPVIPETFVRRPRLVAQLTAGPRTPLTLVEGPAGAGKTCLVADWITGPDAPGPVAWLTVEPEDNEPGVFWTYVLEAVRRHGIPLPDTLTGPSRAGAVDHSLLTRLAAWLSGRETPVTLVLDDFDRVADSAEVADELQFVLRHADGGLRLVVISRTRPLLPLHRYRAAGEFIEVDADNLAFRTEEAAALVAAHGLALSEDGVRALTERTGGWAAGLRLSALEAQRADDPEYFLGDFDAGRSTLADFLLAEVLHERPAEAQDLLLRTSILERTHPGLADALTGRDDAEPVLAELLRANAFLEPLGHSWYRLNPLFAEVLRVHLRERSPGLEPELHRTASAWLSAAGLLDEALSHAAEAGDWELAAAELVDGPAIGRLLDGPDAGRLDGLFAGMPPDTPGPAADLVRAARELTRHDVELGFAYLRRAEESLPDAGAVGDGRDGPVGAGRDAAAVRLSSALLRALGARVTGSADMAEAAVETAAEAERTLHDDRLEPFRELRAGLLTDVGAAQLWEGRFEAAHATLSAVVETVETTALDGAPSDIASLLAGSSDMAEGDGPSTARFRCEALGRIALIEFLHGRPGRAESHARAVLAETERAGLPELAGSGAAELVLAAVAMDRHDLPAAHDHLDRGAAPSARSDAPRDPVVAALLALLRSRLLHAEGDPRAALRVLDELAERTTAPVDRSPWVSDLVTTATAAAHLAEDDPKAAVEVFEKRPPHGAECRVAEARARLAAGQGEAALGILDGLSEGRGEGPAVVARVLLARAQTVHVLGDTVTAENLVLRALAAARPHHLRRPFLEAGPWLWRLLARRPARARGHDWLLPVLPRNGAVPDLPQEDPPEPLTTPLSEREQDALERLAQFMTTLEIAADLHLSVNTVKTHLKTLYRKLGVTRRGEAVRRARELGLL
ncbi:LuxR C-terminal-related transcriptional regulator [Streptomyces sp. NPDC048629]|uniref:helix-turn-helix transcriptional regulator n=1 Tax=Streptomyces sp. NPDC048629 TaxID=3154824 RepID=UPI003424D549